MRILEEVYEMPGCPEEMKKKCEIWREVKQCGTLEMAEVETAHGPKRGLYTPPPNPHGLRADSVQSVDSPRTVLGLCSDRVFTGVNGLYPQLNIR
jgi:hypothetical protein